MAKTVLTMLGVICIAGFASSQNRPIILFWCSKPEMLHNATHITPQVWTKNDTSSFERLKGNPAYELNSWLKRNIVPLRWMGYPHEKSEQELVDYWASAAQRGYIGIAIDEIGHVDTETDKKATSALVKLKQLYPNLFVAVWHAGGLTRELLQGYRFGADLVMLETYGVPFDMERYKRWISERISTVRKAKIVHKTIIALGINDAASPDEWQKVGQWVNMPDALRDLLAFIRQQAPEMRGVAFFAPRASDDMLKLADGLAWEIFGKPAPLHGIIADYNAELRRPDGRVDIEAMISRLKELGVNTYFWLIWHAPTDWDDLQLFLPAAQKAGIKVWVYLVPPSESPPYTRNYSEPFRLDYIRWAEEIARLSLRYPNLSAWVIDDFYANHEFFTPEYVQRMRERAKSINPKLAFLPLMYFHEITRKFVDDYGSAIDGVVVAYPQDRSGIERAWGILNDVFVISPNELGSELEGKGLFHIPFIVMTAGQKEQFMKQHGEPSTPERIASWLKMCLDAMKDGLCDGVVTYCLDKSEKSDTFPLVKQILAQ